MMTSYISLCIFIIYLKIVSSEDVQLPALPRIQTSRIITTATSSVSTPPEKTLFLNETTESRIVQKTVHQPILPMHSGLVVQQGGSFQMNARNKTVANYTTEDLRGKTLRVVGIVEQPFVNYFNLSQEARDANEGAGPGVVMDILREIGSKYDLKYELVDTTESTWGSNDNGNWTGLIGVVQRKEADILAGATIIRSDRHDVLDFPYPFHGSETGMMILSPDQNVDNTFLIVTAPFSVTVWLVTLGAIVVSGLIFKTFCKALNESSEVQYTVLGSVWVFFSVFVQQGLPVQPKSWTCRTMLAFWWLGALTLVATFTGNMVALFAVSRSSLPFKTQEEMVSKVQGGSYKIIMTNTTDTRMLFIQNSELELFQTLWNEMNVKKKWINVSSLTEGVQEVIKRKSVILLGPKETLQVLGANDCNVTTLDNGLIPVWYSIGLQKDSPYLEIFSKEIQILVENGFVAKWLNDYKFKLSSSRGRKCVFSEGVSAAGIAITKERAQGAFWILLAGLCMGFVAFFYEAVCRFVKMLLHKFNIYNDEVNFDDQGIMKEKLNDHSAISNYDPDQHTESVNSYRPTVFATFTKSEETEQTRPSVKWRKKSIMRF